MFAPYYHNALKYAARARREIGVRSIFNMLGPLTNPGSAKRQIIGVFSSRLTELFAQSLHIMGSDKALIVHGYDGLDEISVCAPTRITELSEGVIRSYDVQPEKYFGRRHKLEELRGGNAEENAMIIKRILSGEKGAGRDVVILNSAGALIAAGAAQDFSDGIAMAEESIDNGKAWEKLRALAVYTCRVAPINTLQMENVLIHK
jgi:anthranilate phosphoribosyltransferase